MEIKDNDRSAESDEYFDTHVVYLTLIFQILVFLSALWETIHLDPPLFLHMEYLSYQNTSFLIHEVSFF